VVETASAGDTTAFVSSLANDHCDYLTTAEEYAAQYYEGASTLFGPRQLEFIVGCARDLAAAGAVQEAQPRHFDFTVHRYLAAPDGKYAERVLGDARFTDSTVDEDAYWELSWTDVSPGDLSWHEPLVHVEAADGSVAADDDGWHLGVTYAGVRGGSHTYRARWYHPPLGRPGRHRFVLRANGPQPEVAGEFFD
jgi:neutral ceramidase